MAWVKKIISIIAGIAALTGIIFGINAYEAQFATADDIKRVMNSVALLEQRLEHKIMEDRLHAAQQRMWALEDRYGGANAPEAPAEIRNSYRELRYESTLLRQKIGGSDKWRQQ